MNDQSRPHFTRSLFLSALLLSPSLTLAAAPLQRVSVDASESQRHVLHTHLTIPAKPGPLTLAYPKWIPGEHGPTGPIASVVGLRITAAGHQLAWHRDDEDMYAFKVDVPAGVSELDVRFDLVPSGPGARHTADGWSSARLAIVNWNQVVLVPRGIAARDVLLAPSLTAPAGWKLGTALTATKHEGARTDFASVSLETLVDSPVLMGEIFRTITLSSDSTPPHRLNLAGDSEASIAINEQLIARYRQLVLEAGLYLAGGLIGITTSSSRSVTRWRNSGSSTTSPVTIGSGSGSFWKTG